MRLFGKSKFEKLQYQIFILDYNPQKKLDLCNEMLAHLHSQNDENDYYLREYYMTKSESLYGLKRYVESLESWEKSNEYLNTVYRKMSTDEIIFKSKLLNRLGKYAEALNCINHLEQHLAKYGDMSIKNSNQNIRQELDILDTINTEIPVVKIYSMHEYGSPKSEIISYLQYLHDKMYFTKRDGRNHQKRIAILITNVNQWEFKSELDVTKEVIFPKDEIPTTDVHPLNILKFKLAKGQITIEEYKKIVKKYEYVFQKFQKEEASIEKEEYVMKVQAYCKPCRAKTDIKDPKEVKLQNGRPAVKGSCSVCGTNAFRIGAMPKETTPPKDETTPPKDEIPTTDDPLNILKIRLEKGEITIEEYNEIKEILESKEMSSDES
jgi:uncharacterized membrane protein